MDRDAIDTTLESDYLKTIVKNTADLDASERDRLYGIMSDYFDDVDEGRFQADLSEKDWVLLAKSVATGEILGFSTLARWEIDMDEQPIVAFFSGDTVIHPAYWGRNDGVRVFLRHVMSQLASSNERPTFWLLLTSTYVSYLFLPRLFKEFFPKPESPIPPEMKRRLDELVRRKFPEEYHAERGVVVLKQPTPIRSGATTPDPHFAGDPHVAFFFEANPGYVNSDFLACIAELKPSNLTALGKRLISD